MGKVLKFTGVTYGDIDPNSVLDGAKDNLDECMVIGWMADNFYIASSVGEAGNMLIMLEKARATVMAQILEDE